MVSEKGTIIVVFFLYLDVQSSIPENSPSLAGSPLNRLSFLREDYTFLAGAFSHPSSRFILFKTLSPLIKSPTELYYASYSEIQALVPVNPFAKTEKEQVEEFDSRIEVPQVVFLGIDEKVGEGAGFHYKNFTGAPHFAIDITPKKYFEKEAVALAENFLGNGLKFSEGMRAMSFPADVGKFGTFFCASHSFAESVD